MPKIVFAYQHGKIVSVDEVPIGEACQCVCPSCYGKLVARKGEVKAHHFAHKGGVECIGAFEASLRLAAVKILSEAPYIQLPAFYGDRHTISSEPLRESEKLFIEHVSEKKITETKSPDVIVYGHRENGNKMALLVDTRRIAWETNTVKFRKLHENNLSAITVEVNTRNQDLLSIEDIKAQIIDQTSNKRWIYDESLEYITEQYNAKRTLEAENIITKSSDDSEYKLWLTEQEREATVEKQRRAKEAVQHEAELDRIAQRLDVDDPILNRHRDRAQKAYDILFPPGFQPTPVRKYPKETIMDNPEKYLQEVADQNFYQNDHSIIDSGNHRWCMCKECGEIKPAGGIYNQFMVWGGEWTLNFGKCIDCYNAEQEALRDQGGAIHGQEETPEETAILQLLQEAANS